jgi:group I intron endonuclease
MTRGIYKIINIINNKFYVGSAVDLKRRKARHFSELRTNKHNNRHLQTAWNKYGEQAFVFVVLEEIADDADLLAAENIWLHENVGKDYCYNIGVDATAPMQGMTGELSPTWGYKHTDSALLNIGAASAGRLHRPESKELIRQHLIGKPKTAAVRAKISATLSGEGNFWYGKERSEDFKAKIRKSVVVTDAAGVETIYPSVQAVREALQLKPPTVNRALKSGLALVRGPHIGLSFKYVTPALNV